MHFTAVEEMWEYEGHISDLRIEVLLGPLLPGQQKRKTEL